MSISECLLCNKASNKQGGSLASDAVVSLVSCDTFEQMNNLATNKFSGGKKQPKKTPKPQVKKQVKKQYHGGHNCDDIMTSSALDQYVLGPASLPRGLPGVNEATFDYANVQASVLASLSHQAPTLSSTYHNVVYPDYFVNENILAQTSI